VPAGVAAASSGPPAELGIRAAATPRQDHVSCRRSFEIPGRVTAAVARRVRSASATAPDQAGFVGLLPRLPAIGWPPSPATNLYGTSLEDSRHLLTGSTSIRADARRLLEFRELARSARVF